MQPNDDFRNDDAQLRELLREWDAPPAPASLDKRVLASRQGWWRFLINGYIRVPVPVACCVAVLILLAAWRSIRPDAAGAPCSIAEQHSIIERHSIIEQPAVCASAIPDAC